jgi:hypothetical protein
MHCIHLWNFGSRWGSGGFWGFWGSRLNYSLFFSGVPLSSSGDFTNETWPFSCPKPFDPAAVRPPCSADTILPSHFNVSLANISTRAVQGRRRYARTRRRSSIPTTSRPLPTFSGGGSWAEPLWKTAPRRIPTEGVRFRASPSCFRPPPLVPGLFSFRARVIFRADGPTRPTQRLPVRGAVPRFPHPEPPLLSSDRTGLSPSSLRADSLELVHRQLIEAGHDSVGLF